MYIWSWNLYNLRIIIHKLINNYIQTNYTHKVAKVESQPRPQSNFKKIALAPHDFAGNFYPI